MTPTPPTPSIADRGREKLAAIWERLGDGSITTDITPDISAAIAAAVESGTKSYRYVLPTQLLAKSVDSSLDCRAVQDSSSLNRSFDARSFCKSVIVPFDRANHNVLGGSGDPYVNNPLRIAEITEQNIAPQRDKRGFGNLITVLTYAQQHPDQVEQLLVATLLAIRERLRRTTVTYPAPSRASLDDTVAAFSRFLDERTGGRRMQAIVVALCQTIGERFGLFDRVVSGHVNTADAASGHAGDVECFADDRVVLAVDAKDRQLEVHEVESKLPAARERELTELLFVIRGGLKAADADAFEQLRERQFRAGHNIYHCELADLLRTCNILFGEDGRRHLLEQTGRAIDEYCELHDREVWAKLLAEL